MVMTRITRGLWKSLFQGDPKLVNLRKLIQKILKIPLPSGVPLMLGANFQLQREPGGEWNFETLFVSQAHPDVDHCNSSDLACGGFQRLRVTSESNIFKYEGSNKGPAFHETSIVSCPLIRSTRRSENSLNLNIHCCCLAESSRLGRGVGAGRLCIVGGDCRAVFDKLPAAETYPACRPKNASCREQRPCSKAST